MCKERPCKYRSSVHAGLGFQYNFAGVSGEFVSMTTKFAKRVTKELRSLAKDPLTGIKVEYGVDLQHYTAIVEGVEDTAFEGGVFVLSVVLGDAYPQEPPLIIFQTKCFHPNIYRDGKICLDILQKNWVSSYTLGSVLQSIQQLLSDPNPDSPANTEASSLFVDDKREYLRRVRECVEASWI